MQDAVTLAVVRPQFRAFASLPLRQAVSGTWARNQLFLLTPDSLVVAFAAAGGGGGRIIGLGGTNDPFLEVTMHTRGCRHVHTRKQACMHVREHKHRDTHTR